MKILSKNASDTETKDTCNNDKYDTPEQALKILFGYDSFRAGQKSVIDSILAGRDAFAVMPTGAGKSVCYQIPAVLLPGITLVVSPLISLMQDQVKALNEAGVPAAFINSSLSEKDYNETIRRARQGVYKIIYIAPERCVKEELAFNYELTREITPILYELFKPFGKIVEQLGDKRLGEVYVVDANSVAVLRLQGKIGTKKLKIIVDHPELMRAKDAEEAKRKLDCQITKYQMCLGCRACESVCRFSAIKVRSFANDTNTVADKMADYHIDDDKCRRCQECVGHFSVGCYMRKVLSIKR